MPKTNPRKKLPLLWIPLFGSLALLGALCLYPLESVVALRKAALRAGGVRRVRAGTLAAYERDSCIPGTPCRCVALIHGLGDSALTWDGILLGGSGAAAPPAGTRYLAIELPGSEGSLPPASPAGYAVPAMAETVRGALEERCAEWTVAGNSLGGWVAAWLALKWPAGVKRLILINAAGLYEPTLIETARILENPTPEKMKGFLARAFHRPAPVPSRAWPAVVAAIRGRPTARIVAAMSMEAVLDRKASAIRVPTLVLWGASDRIVPQALGERFARLIPGARMELIPDCGHLPQQECPAAVSRALIDPLR